MIKIARLTLMAALTFGSAAAYAGGDCCPGAKAGASDCGAAFASLNLSDEQKSKIAALKQECDKEGCSEAALEKFTKGLADILTPEQLAQFKAACEKKQDAASKAEK